MAIKIKQEFISQVRFILWKCTKTPEFAVQYLNDKTEVIGSGIVRRNAVKTIEATCDGLRVDSAKGVIVAPQFNSHIQTILEQSFIALEKEVGSDRAEYWMPIKDLLAKKVKSEGGVAMTNEKLKRKKVKSEGAIAMRRKLKSVKPSSGKK